MTYTILVDYDGVLEIKNGQMNYELIKKLNEKEARIIIWTSRDWLYYDYIKFNLERAGLKFQGIVCGKPLGDIYLDDRTVYISDFMKGKNAQ